MNFLGQVGTVQSPFKIFKVKIRSFLVRLKNSNIAGNRTINGLYNTAKTISKSVEQLSGNFEEKKEKKQKHVRNKRFSCRNPKKADWTTLVFLFK